MITIIVTTHNSPRHLRRILKYFSDLNCDLNIFITDASCDENKEKNKETIKAFSSLAIEHFCYDEKIDYISKVYEAVSRVDTNYVVLTGDDDFVSISGVKKCAIFLEKNDDYIFAQGNYYGFSYSDQNKDASWFLTNPVYHVKSKDSRFAKNRLEQVLWNTMQSFYSVFRTKTLQLLLKECKENLPLQDFSYLCFFFEFFFNSLSAILGKSAFLNIPYAFREMSNDSWGAKNSKNL